MPLLRAMGRGDRPCLSQNRRGRFAPLRRVHINEIPDDLTPVSDPAFTLTFILVEDGRELARIEGYPGDDWFWPLLEALLEQNTTYMPGDPDGIWRGTVSPGCRDGPRPRGTRNGTASHQ